MWDLVKPGLEEVKRRSGDWRCEDIYTAIRTGISTLHIADADEYEGFVVLTPLTTVSGKCLEITVGYSTSIKKVTEYIPEIERMARAIGAKAVVVSSTRNWGRYFTPKCTVFYREV